MVVLLKLLMVHVALIRTVHTSPNYARVVVAKPVGNTCAIATNSKEVRSRILILFNPNISLPPTIIRYCKAMLLR